MGPEPSSRFFNTLFATFTRTVFSRSLTPLQARFDTCAEKGAAAIKHAAAFGVTFRITCRRSVVLRVRFNIPFFSSRSTNLVMEETSNACSLARSAGVFASPRSQFTRMAACRAVKPKRANA